MPVKNLTHVANECAGMAKAMFIQAHRHKEPGFLIYGVPHTLPPPPLSSEILRVLSTTLELFTSHHFVRVTVRGAFIVTLNSALTDDQFSDMASDVATIIDAWDHQHGLQSPFFQEALFRTLLSGAHARPALPSELAQIIFLYAALTRPLRLNHVRKRFHTSVAAEDASVQSTIVLATPPISLHQNAPASVDADGSVPHLRIGRHNWLRVQAVSKDQGWCSQPDAGCWSWFEIGIGRLKGPDADTEARSGDRVPVAENEAEHEVEAEEEHEAGHEEEPDHEGEPEGEPGLVDVNWHDPWDDRDMALEAEDNGPEHEGESPEGEGDHDDPESDRDEEDAELYRPRTPSGPPIDDISICPDPMNVTQELVWHSHGNPIGVDNMAEHEGIELEPDHQLWDLLQDGDVIFVRACAQFGGWSNHMERVRLQWKVDFESCL